MPAYTSFLTLYKPGGGSTGLIVPDEVVDIDRLNANMDLIDTFAQGHGLAANRNIQFYGPEAGMAGVAGMKRGDTYQESDSDFDKWVYDGIGWKRTRPPVARLAKAGDQASSGTDGLYTEVTWSSDASGDGLWVVGNPSRIRLDRVGWWRVSASLRGSASQLYGRIGLNGINIPTTEQSGAYFTLEDFVLCTTPTTDYAGIHIAKTTGTGATVSVLAAFSSARAVYLGDR